MERNLAAEVRAVEEGHLCRVDADRGRFLVKADSWDGTYELTAQAVGDLVRFSCQPTPAAKAPRGVQRHARQVPLGVAPCKHAALVARRLERAGLVRFDGRLWRYVGGAS